MSPEEQRQAIQRISLSLRGKKPRILLVEDCPDDAILFLRTLQFHGLEAVWVKDAEPAIDLLRGEGFQVVFLDLKLQTSAGIDLLNFVKSHNVDSQVIVLTGALEDDPECKEALKLGASAVMLKPLSNDQVGLIFGTP
jgi:DNA-binding NtrC family response regulator